jgi:thioredoxin-related protein
MRLSIIALLLFVSSLGYSQETINWLKIEDLEAAQAKEPRKVIIDLYTDWCHWCHKMDKNTFQNPGIAAYVNENFYAVRFNAEQKDTIVFKGQKFGFVAKGRKGYNELAAALAKGRLSYPTIVYLDLESNLIQAVPGYMDAAAFEKVITYLGEDHHKEQEFEQYKMNYSGNIHKSTKE